jgi:branched-chain amino acid transport system substrate-binding protein
VAAVLTAACGGGKGGASTIKLGLLTDESGPFKSFGSDISTAVNLAVEEINAAGGVNGSTLSVVTEDTSGDSSQAVIGLRNLTSAGVFAVIGPISSSEAEAVFAQASTLPVPILTGTANKEGLTDLGKGWAFRDTATNTQLYSASMPIFKSNYGVTHVALVYDEKQGFAQGAVKGAIPGVAHQLGITIDQTLTVTTGQTDFTTVVQRVKGMSGIDGLIIVTSGLEGGGLASELSRQGVTLPVLGHPAQNSADFREAAGDSVHQWVLPSVVDPGSTSPKAVAFAAAMKLRDKEPPTVPEAANYYDIVRMIAQVAGSAGLAAKSDAKDARKAIRDGLTGLKGFEGVAGVVSFKANGDVDRPVYTLLLEGTNPPTVLTP